MKIFVKTLKVSHFEIEVEPEDTVAGVKKNIEKVQGSEAYPASQQMLIHQGKVLKDDTTLEENKVAENSFVVIMLAKKMASSSGASTTSAAPASIAQSASNTPAPTQPIVAAPTPGSDVAPPQSAPESAPVLESATTLDSIIDVYGQAASNPVQNIHDMGGGSFNRGIIARVLHAAFNNPERAGIREQAELAPAAQPPASGLPVNPSAQATQPTVPSGGPDANSLDLFPEIRTPPAMVQANPQMLQSMVRHIGNQNPELVRMIQEHPDDFVRRINEPDGEEDWNILGKLAEAILPSFAFTPEERESMSRLEAMGFDRRTVLDAFVDCDKNEELAAKYLLDHMHDKAWHDMHDSDE